MGYLDDSKNVYEFVDFEGGPFLQVGDVLLMNVSYKENRKIIKLKPSEITQADGMISVLVEVE